MTWENGYCISNHLCKGIAYKPLECISLQRIFTSLAILTLMVFLSFQYLGNVNILHPYNSLQRLWYFEPNQSLSKTAYLSAIADIDRSMLPSLPEIPIGKTDLFKQALSENEVNMLSATLQTFHQVMVNASLQYFLYKGSLLGSYRHHGTIPWDDDLDVLVHLKDKDIMLRTFQKSLSKYRMVVYAGRFKFFDESAHTIKRYYWRAPFVDVTFYNDNSTHLWDTILTMQPAFLKSDVFPLRDRPYLGHLYPAPRDPLVNLQVTYKIDDCYTGDYNHTSETFKNGNKIMTIPCSALLDLVPFVSHVRGPGGAWCYEVLTFRGQVLNTFIRDAKDIPVC